MKTRFLLQSLVAVGLALTVQACATAQIMSFNQDFDAVTPGGSALSDLGFQFFSDNAGLGSYNGDAPGDGPQISSLADDGTGNQFINFFANYDNTPVHTNPALRESISLFVSQDFTAADAALEETFAFDFDFAANADALLDPTTDVVVGAFIRVFDPNFNLLAEQTFDTFTTDTAFTSGQLSQALSADFTDGGVLQFGFNNTVGNFDPSGVFYDNVSFATTAVPEPSSAVLGALIGFGLIARRRR